MKKIILGIITCLLSLSVFGQVNEFKFGFPLRANGGLNVGTNKVQLDSIVRDGTTIKFYTGVTELLPNMAGGSVTSVGMTVPTGLSISGSPITSFGTLALTFAPGYSIPSNASQSNWNTAYNWGDHNLGGYESSLGNPSVNGYILSSTTTGTRSWIAPPSGGSMIYPSGSGIPLVVSGTSWGTTITNNSANWNTAYGWGNHASAGYQTSTAILNSFAALTNSAGVLTNDGSGGLTWTAVGGTGTVTSVALSVPTGLSISGSPITSSGTLAISLASGYSIPSTSVQSDWTTAYNERAQWDGGSTNLVASTGRTSLGATTVGSNLFTLNNPNAIRFIRINADNTVSVLTATDFKTALSLTAADVGLSNVTNESKTTMFTSPIFTGVAPRLGSPVTDTVATRGNIRSSISALLSGGIQLSDVAVMREDTLTSGGIYYTQRQVDSIMATITGVSLTDVRNEIADSLNAIRSASVQGVALSDSTDLYVTVTRLRDSLLVVRDSINVLRSEIDDLWLAFANLGTGDVTAPYVESAELGTYSDSIIVVLLSASDVQQDSIPPTSAFTIYEDAVEMGIADVSINYDTVFIALDSIGIYSAEYTFDYTRAYPMLQDSTGNRTQNFTSQTIINNISAPAAQAPAFLTNDGDTDGWFIADADNFILYNTDRIGQWSDVSGNARHLIQNNNTYRPIWNDTEVVISSADAGDWMVNASYSSAQPFTIYLVVNQTTYEGQGDWLVTLGDIDRPVIKQGGVNTALSLDAGSEITTSYNVQNDYILVTAVINGANSSIQINDNTAVTGNAGTMGATGIMVGFMDNTAIGENLLEYIIRGAADDASEINQVKTYLNSKYNIY